MKSASAEGLRNPFEKIITPEELARQAALEAKEKEPEAASLHFVQKEVEVPPGVTGFSPEVHASIGKLVELPRDVAADEGEADLVSGVEKSRPGLGVVAPVMDLGAHQRKRLAADQELATADHHRPVHQ